MSTEFGMVLCALIGMVVLGIDNEITKVKIKNLEVEIEYIHNYHLAREANLIKRIDQNSELCSQVNDLDIGIKITQKDAEHALEMIEELKAKRSMDILDKLREESDE